MDYFKKLRKAGERHRNKQGRFVCHARGADSAQYSHNLLPVNIRPHRRTERQPVPDLMSCNVARWLSSACGGHFHPSVMRRSGFSPSAASVVHIHLPTGVALRLYLLEEKCAAAACDTICRRNKGPVLPPAHHRGRRGAPWQRFQQKEPDWNQHVLHDHVAERPLYLQLMTR